jgi:FkbM family methyltransferase
MQPTQRCNGFRVIDFFLSSVSGDTIEYKHRARHWSVLVTSERSTSGSFGQVVMGLANLVPKRVKTLVLGKNERPSWLANRIHSVLDRVPVERYPCLECTGALKGYRMRIDWQRHRGFIYGTWEPDVVTAICGIVQPGWVAVDVGAHIGYFALILARLVGPEGSVFAFEPVPSNFHALEENLSLNQITQVQAINKAVFDKSGQLELKVLDGAGLPDHASIDDTRGVRSITVESISLDDFFAQRKRPIDFLKMDVEGAEGSVLQGARKLIAADHPIMEIEIHYFDGHPENNPVPEMLQDWGYQIRWIDQSENWTSHLMANWPGTRS